MTDRTPLRSASPPWTEIRPSDGWRVDLADDDAVQCVSIAAAIPAPPRPHYAPPADSTRQLGDMPDRFDVEGDGLAPPDAALRIVPPGDAIRWLALWMYCPWWLQPVWREDVGALPERCQLVLAQHENGEFSGYLPAVIGASRADLAGLPTEACLELRFRWHPSPQPEEPVLGLVAARDDDPHRLVKRLVACLRRQAGTGFRLRDEKPYPEPFSYLGWCTWDAFYTDVNAKRIEAGLRSLREAHIPVRLLVVDDGWQDTRDRRLWSLGTRPGRFPTPLRSFVRRVKSRWGIRRIALWHALQGYWEGLHPDGPAASVEMAGPFTPEKANRFYGVWYEDLAHEGIDAVKVDNQASLSRFDPGTASAAEKARLAQRALQDEATDKDLAILNCMACSPEHAFRARTSNLTRSSNDFWPRQPETTGEHAVQNAFTSLLLGEVQWCDFDMFWSEHDHAPFHALLRAVSGGPVYLSDEPGHHDPHWVNPLATAQGRVLRADRPGRPTASCLMADIRAGKDALLICNTVTRPGGYRSGLCGLFHPGYGDCPLTATVRPADIPGLEGERFAAYEVRTGRTALLDRWESWAFDLAPLEGRLALFVPLDGVVPPVIGLVSKFIPPATIESMVPLSVNRWELTLCEGGPLLVYSERPVARIRSGKRLLLDAPRAGWLRLRVPPGRGPRTLLLELPEAP